jgi:putative transposase
MARLPRLVLPGEPHLVVQRALPQRPAFADDTDRRAYAEALREALATERVALHAYALAADEVRLVMTPARPGALARLVQHLGRRYVAHHHRRHGGSGPLWQGRYRCVPLDADASLDAMRWVDGEASEGFSSEARHMGAATARLGDLPLQEPPAYWALGNTPFEREAAYRRLLAEGLPSARVASLLAALKGGWAVGAPAFAAHAAQAGGRAAVPRPRGRPARFRALPGALDGGSSGVR